MDLRPHESAALMFFGLVLAAGAYLGAGLESGVWTITDIAWHVKDHGVGVLFWVVVVVSLIPAVIVAALVLKAGDGQCGSGSRKASAAHMVTYRQVAGSLGHDAAVKAARQKAKISMPPVSPDPKESARLIGQWVDEMPESWLVTELGKLGGKVVTKKGSSRFVGGKPIFGEAKESKLVLAPTQAGKTTSIASNLVLDAPGAVMATSTKADLLMMTACTRQRLHPSGQVVAFDLDDSSGWPHKAAWNPVAGCENFEVAQRRAQAWAGAQPMSGTKNGDWFNQQAGAFLARFLHVAAVSGKTLNDVIAWSQNLRGRDALKTAEMHAGHINPEVLAFLAAKQESKAAETLDSIQQTLSGLLEPLAVPRIREQLMVHPAHAFDMREFLSGPNTLFLVSDTATGVETGPLVSMFANELINTARELSQEKPGGRLWPCFRAVLDEAPNLAAFPKMDSIMSDINGRGVEVILIAQSMSQLIDRWGEQGGRTIVGNSVVKYYLPGLDVETMRPVSEALGKFEKQRVSRSHSSGTMGNTSTSHSTEEKLVMEAAEMTQIPAFSAMVSYKNYRPMHLGLTPWWERPDADEVKEDQLRAWQLCGKMQLPDTSAFVEGQRVEREGFEGQ